MDASYLAQFYQTPHETLLMDFIKQATEQENLLDLSIGDPDLTTPNEIIQAAFADAQKGHTHYTAADGSAEFIESILNFYQRYYQLTFSKKQVRATVGALHGMYLTLQVLLNPGDEVIIHEPFFSPYETQIIEAGGTPIIVPTFAEDQFELDPKRLEAMITPQTKALIINSPNNPTGAVFSKTTLEAIANLAKKHDFFILSDEVYEAFCFQEAFMPMARLAPEHTITFGSFSKAFAMTGWRIGYMIAPDYINDACRLLNEDVTYSAPSISQQAGIYALNHYEKLVPPLVSTYEKRLRYVEEQVQQISFFEMQPLKGSLYAFINIEKSGLSSVAFAKKLLTECGVLVIPGKAFGISGDGHIRLAATQSMAVLEKAFQRIKLLSF
ncbi:pyridoxal phosphate-dependent aminotransferase [Vagococcus sp.]|uniref:pyridoxal phosphate-dependent aminotransferase n=1 Tax=Vagococcus sp. TaxID=1933889 RepID=UPI003F9A9D1F